MRFNPILRLAPADRSKGPVGTTSGSGGAESFLPPEQSQRAHLTPTEPGAPRAPMANADIEEGGTGPGAEATEAGADNPVRGED